MKSNKGLNPNETLNVSSHIEKLKQLRSYSNTIQNLSYKLDKDRNISHFLNNLVDNINNYDSLEHMTKYYFENDIIAVKEILEALLGSLSKHPNYMNKKGIEIAKPTSVFPDNIGSRILIQLSVLPLLQLFTKKIEYLKNFKKLQDLEKELQNDFDKSNERKELFNDNGDIIKKRIRSWDFEDSELEYKTRSNMQEEYEKIKTKLSDDIIKLSHMYKTLEKVNLGVIVYDNKFDLKNLDLEECEKTILELIETEQGVLNIAIADIIEFYEDFSYDLNNFVIESSYSNSKKSITFNTENIIEEDFMNSLFKKMCKLKNVVAIPEKILSGGVGKTFLEIKFNIRIKIHG